MIAGLLAYTGVSGERSAFLLILFFSSFLITEPRLEFDQTALDNYVHSIDGSYEYEVIKKVPGEVCKQKPVKSTQPF